MQNVAPIRRTGVARMSKDGSAKAKCRPTLKVQEEWWGTRYVGSRDELVALGVVEASWLAGVPEAGRWRKRRRIALADGGRVVIGRRAAQAITVERWLPEAEREKRRDALFEACQRELAQVQARDEIDSLPQSADHYRARLRNLAAGVFGLLLNALDGGAGYTLCPEAEREIREAMREVIEEISEAEVSFSPSVRTRIETEIRAAALPDDPTFQRFIVKAIKG